MAKHEFGIMKITPKLNERYDTYEPEKYDCISIHDDFIEPLASSEGLNKHTNRMIRYNVMKDFLFGLTEELVAATETLYDKMVSTSMKPTEDPEE